VAVTARRHTRPRVRAFLSATVVALALSATFATAAHANPTPSSIEATSTTLENEIDAQWRMLEPTIENYDLVHQNLQKQQKAAAVLEAQIEPLALQVQVQLATVHRIAVSEYMAGPSGTLTTLLDTDGSTQALTMLGELNQVAKNRNAEVASAVKLQKAYEAKAKPINALVASLQVQQTSLNAQKVAIQKKINTLNSERLAAFGTTKSAGSTRPVPCPQVYTGDPGSRAARYACAQIGKPYIWDHAGPNSFDCSGLTLAAWSTVGVSMPHNAYAQAHTFRSVSSGSLKPGDLVFYYHPISHVTIYVGNGWVVSAPRTGDVVRMQKVNHGVSPSGYVRP
jgi:peptidoglycan DL-endopeptidase CwlO